MQLNRCLLIFFICVTASSSLLANNDKPRAFSISSQPLGSALVSFARQADVSIIVQKKYTQGLVAPEVKGEMTAVQVLDKLLLGTNLDYKFINEKTLSITKKFGHDESYNSIHKPISHLDQDSSIEEVTVTSAYGLNKNLQILPIAVTYLDQQTVEKVRIENLQSIASKTPGIVLTDFGLRTFIGLRGISSNDPGIGAETSVPVYIDDVYQGRTSNINNGLFDLEGIEILRGPQGALYGRNALGGVIRLVTTKPDHEQFQGKVKVGAGRFNQREISTLLSGPIAKGLASKLFFMAREDDGPSHNVVLNKKQEEDKRWAYRGQLSYAMNNTEWSLSTDFSRIDIGGGGVSGVPIVNGFLPLVDFHRDLCGDSIRCIASAVDGFAEQKNYGSSFQLNKTFGQSTFTSITAYRFNDVERLIDWAYFPQNPYYNSSLEENRQFSEEFRWTSTFANNINYLIGGTLFYETSESLEALEGLNDTVLSASETLEQDSTTRSYAVFNHVDWAITEQWSLELGMRYTWEEKELSHDVDLFSVFFGNDRFSDTASDRWTIFSPKVVLGYQFANGGVFTYFAFNKGFKSGGFASIAIRPENLQALDPEIATNYELGVKWTSFDNAWRLNAAVFNTQYKDIQFRYFSFSSIGGFNSFETSNLGDAEASGFELEASFSPLSSVDVVAAYSYVDSKYKDFQFIDDIGNSRNLSGQFTFLTSRNKFTLGIQSEWLLNKAYQITIRYDYDYVDGQVLLNTFTDRMPSYALSNLNLSFADHANDYEISLWIKNLFDKEYVSQIYGLRSGDIAVYENPRTYGLTFSLKFD